MASSAVPSATVMTRTRSRCSPLPPRTGWASRSRWPTRRSPRPAPPRTSWPHCATCSARTAGRAGGTALLDVGDGLDRGRLWQGLGLVMGPDALDVVAAPVGETLGGLHPALGDQDAQVGAVEPVLARAVDPHEEGLILGSDVVPVVADVLERKLPAIGQVPRAGARGSQDPLDRVARLL